MAPEQIKLALQMLEVDNEDHWTADGLPRMDVVEGILDDTSVTRKMVTDAAPLFTQDNPVIDAVETESEEDDTETGEGESEEDDTETGEGESEEDDTETGEGESEEDDADLEDMAEDDVLADIEADDPEDAEPTYEELVADAEAAMANLQETNKAVDDAKKLQSKAQFKLDRAEEKRVSAKGQNASQGEISRYLKSQNGQRAQRGENNKTLKEALKGIDPKSLNVKAPIDQAMARKNTRGTGRPKQS